MARLGSVSLLGEGAVDITPSTRGRRFPTGATSPAGRTPKAVADITDQASEGIDQINGLIRDVRRGKGTVGKLMTDEQLYVELNEFVGDRRADDARAPAGPGHARQAAQRPEGGRNLEASLKNLEELTRRINAGEGSLGKLLNDEAFSQSLTGATANLKDITDRLNRGEGTAGKLMTDPSLFNRLNSVTERFDVLVTS